MKKGSVLIRIGLLLIIGAVAVAGYNFYDDFRAKNAVQRSMVQLQSLILPSAAPTDEPMALQMDETAPAWDGLQPAQPGMTLTTAQPEHPGLTLTTPQPEQPGLTLTTPQPEQPELTLTTPQTEQPGLTLATAQPVAQNVPRIPQDPIAVDVLKEVEIPDYILNPKMEMPVVRIDGQDYIGMLEIPVLELEIPVISHWDYPKLRIAPCRYVGSAYTNDLVISAHNYQSHFGGLKKLNGGERVIFTDVDGNRFDYRVDYRETLGPREVEAMTTGDWDLTLFTCTVGGSYRVTVRCSLLTDYN